MCDVSVMNQSVSLRVFSSSSKVISRPVTVARGQRLALGELQAENLKAVHGVIGGYRISLSQGEVLPVNEADDAYYIWDNDSPLHSPLFENEFQLESVTLNRPSVARVGGACYLVMQPEFQVSFTTATHSARLGEIRLVESERFVTLENGDSLTITDTQEIGAPVLYLQHRDDTAVVRQETDLQLQGTDREYFFGESVSQKVPDYINSVAVSSVTVLERFTSYFMQQVLSTPEQSIWVPVCAPISWGWSIRVGRRYDQEWDILRRKLMLPTVGHDGWEMPTWRSNLVQSASEHF
ncbi:MAG: hypothetical protein CMK89_03540 [Pseudomonadales bacterium]|nr:hypothetical protein [Pseudomonadales bacterium]